MKTGRNAPCPCGSGKKHKNRCLHKTVTAAKTLDYRRLSKLLDKLMPRLIDQAESAFGEMVVSFAMAAFFGWPDPDEEPDEAAIDRAGVLFWPWLVFNWEYNPLEDEEGLLHGPEETTVAELYATNKSVDPQSLEGQLISAANRNPYSFLEITAVRPAQSVRVKDLMTGAQTNVQERLGSEVLQPGDILFGRVVPVKDVGMFLGLSAFVLPPRVKPQLIALRRSMSRGRGKANRDELTAWDLEIRQVFWNIDRALHTPPELRNTDGDPLELHKLIYDIDSPDLAVEKLAPLCVVETVEEIRAAAEKDKDGKIHRATFDWGRKGNRAESPMPNTVLGKIDIGARRMTVAVNSSRRAETIRKQIEKRLGAAARLRLDEIADLEATMRDDGGPPLAEKELMAHPEIQRHIGQMLHAHWDNWVDQEIPALGYKTPKQAVRSADGREAVEALLLDAEKTARYDPGRASIENELIAEVRRRLKLDRPLSNRRGAPEPGQLAERVAQIKARIEEFGGKRLNDTYTGFALDLCDVIAGTDRLNIHRGHINIWAAAVVYAIARLNFLFSRDTVHHLTPDELCSWFDVKKTTVSSKTARIRTALDLFYDDQRFCAPHVTSMFRFYENEDGFVFPANALTPETDGDREPLPLKPGAGVKEKASKRTGKPPKQTKKNSDRQLPIFKD